MGWVWRRLVYNASITGCKSSLSVWRHILLQKKKIFFSLPLLLTSKVPRSSLGINPIHRVLTALDRNPFNSRRPNIMSGGGQKNPGVGQQKDASSCQDAIYFSPPLPTYSSETEPDTATDLSSAQGWGNRGGEDCLPLCPRAAHWVGPQLPFRAKVLMFSGVVLLMIATRLSPPTKYIAWNYQ